MKTRKILTVGLLIGSHIPAVFGQSVEFLSVSKQHSYIQTDNTTTTDAVNPWRFRASVEGGSSDLSAITTPTLIIPGGTGSTTLTYDSGEKSWSVEGSYSSQSALDGAYANSSPDPYKLTALGQTVNLILTGDTYPTAPIATLSGGTISGGVLVWDVSQALTITLDYSGIDHRGLFIFGNNLNVGNEIFGDGPLSYTLNASSLTAGQSYIVELSLDDIVGGTSPSAVSSEVEGMSAAQYAAVYTSQTTFTIQAIPEPAAFGSVAGSLVLMGALLRRRRSVAR